MKTACDVIRDLLPLYQDGVCSAESRKLVEEHLEHCESCRREWEGMNTPMPAHHPQVEEQTVAQAAASAWRRGRRRAFSKGFVIAAVLVVLTCLCVFAAVYHSNTPLEFEGVLSSPTVHRDTGSVSFLLSVDEGSPIYVVVDDETPVFSPFDAYPGQTLRDGALPTPLRVLVELDRNPVTLSMEDGSEVPGYHARLVEFTAYHTPDTLPLTDGTQVEIWQGPTELLYALPQGPVLLKVRTPLGPGEDERLLQLPQQAQDQILAYYETTLAYDLQTELERAYQMYLQWDSSHLFPAQVVRQTTDLAASAPNVLYFTTTVDRYTDGGIIDPETSCTAFYKDTGEPAPLQDLFSCTPETLIQTLVDNSTLVLPEQQPELVEAFCMEYLTFQPDSLVVTYPAGTLPSQEFTTGFHFPYSDALREYMPPWAVPDAA